jgi:hypothetical protein
VAFYGGGAEKGEIRAGQMEQKEIGVFLAYKHTLSQNSPHCAMGRMATIVASLSDAPQRRCRAAVPLLDVQQPALEAHRHRHRFRAVGGFELQENGGDVIYICLELLQFTYHRGTFATHFLRNLPF